MYRGNVGGGEPHGGGGSGHHFPQKKQTKKLTKENHQTLVILEQKRNSNKKMERRGQNAKWMAGARTDGKMPVLWPVGKKKRKLKIDKHGNKGEASKGAWDNNQL